MKHYKSVKDNDELDLDDLPNATGFAKKTWYRLSSIFGNDMSKEIETQKLSETLANEANDNHFGNFVAEPVNTLSNFTSAIALKYPGTAGTIGAISATNNIISQNENNFKMRKQGYDSEEINNNNAFNAISNIGSVITGYLFPKTLNKSYKVPTNIASSNVDILTQSTNKGISSLFDTEPKKDTGYISPIYKSKNYEDNQEDIRYSNIDKAISRQAKIFDNTNLNKTKIAAPPQSPADQLVPSRTENTNIDVLQNQQYLSKSPYGSM